jgi:hypothetical protein
MKYGVFKYTLKVWIASICLTALLFMIVWSAIQFFDNDVAIAHIFTYYAMLLLFTLLTALLSTPALGLFYVLILTGLKFLTGTRAIKIWFNAAGVLVTSATFGLLFSLYPDYDKAFFIPLAAAYCVIISLCVWFFKLKPVAGIDVPEST